MDGEAPSTIATETGEKDHSSQLPADGSTAETKVNDAADDDSDSDSDIESDDDDIAGLTEEEEKRRQKEKRDRVRAHSLFNEI